MKHTKLLLSLQQKRVLHLSTACLWISGAVWLLISEESASRPLWMKLHGAAAMVFLMVFGTLLLRHVPAGWTQNRERPSGGMALGASIILIVTGWGLYYLGSEGLRRWTSLTHTMLGLALPLLIYLHAKLSQRSGN